MRKPLILTVNRPLSCPCTAGVAASPRRAAAGEVPTTRSQ